MEVLDAFELVKLYGPFCIAVIFFIYRDWKREDRMTKRINTLEDEMRNVILPIVQDCSGVIARNTEVITRIEKRLEA